MQRSAHIRLVSPRIFYVVILPIVGIVLTIGVVASTFSFAIVGSSSMSPTLTKGDVLLWTPAEITDIAIGDIVVYKSSTCWPDEKMVVHRVVETKCDGEGFILLETRGDANGWVDQEKTHLSEPYIDSGHIMGKVVCFGSQPVKIPFVGMIGLWF